MENNTPVRKLNSDRNFWVMVLLSIITCGIYPIFVMSEISGDINTVASRYDGKKTMHFCLLCFVVAPITFGIASFVWYHNISERIGAELKRRGISYSFGASDFWLWNVLGSFIVVGPYVYLFKLLKAVNLINEHYNTYG